MKKRRKDIIVKFIIFVLISSSIAFLISGIIYVNAVTRHRMEAISPERTNISNIIK